MVNIKGYEIGVDKLIEKFEHSEKNEKLSVGALDPDVKRFIVSVLKSMIENYEDEEIYFRLVAILSDLVYQLSDYETGYQVWCNVDFSEINSIGDGVREEKERIQEILEFYR